jgi:hypothetical protein
MSPRREMFGHLQKEHAFAFGDIDTDGDEDVFEEMGGAASRDNYLVCCTRIRATATTGSSSNWKA